MDWSIALTISFGLAIGLALGLTGGGGSIFAVPLLIYGLGVDVRQAVGISLAAVGATAAFGALTRWRSGQLEFRTGLLFAAAGMLGAPLGTRLGASLPPAATLSAFALLMIAVGLRMWRQKSTPVRAALPPSSCARDEVGTLRWSSRCAAVLVLAGLLTGVLSGVFGVGGGFIIVPALVLTSRMAIHRAVGTSLLVIALICLSGVLSYLTQGSPLPVALTLLFVLGGLLGMLAGTRLAARLNGPTLNRVFATGMWLVASFVLLRNILN